MSTRRRDRSFRDGWRTGVAIADAIAATGSAIGTALRFVALLVTRPVRVRHGSRGHERAETIKLYHEVRALHRASPLGKDDRAAIPADVVGEACELAETLPPFAVFEALSQATTALLVEEGVWDLPDIDWAEELGLEEGVLLRKYLADMKRFLSDYPHQMGLWRTSVIDAMSRFVAAIPEEIVVGDDDGRTQRFSVALADVLAEPAELIEHIIFAIWHQDNVEEGLFGSVRERLDTNALLASGIDPADREYTTKQLVLPTKKKGATAAELSRLYLAGTPFAPLFRTPCGFGIPEAVRFEHCHVVGGSGHGKTQLLQLMIHGDLLRAQNEPLSLCVIDSQGDLIRTISHIRYFSPGVDGSLSDRFVLIDPNDTAFPVCLNLFAMRVGGSSDLERQRTFNATVALYEYMFGALLGADLTQRQGVIFKYLARLMMVIPGATVHTLRALMEDPDPFRQYIGQLEGTTRAFFETQFESKAFDATKKQILTRLWGVLSNDIFERMFSHEKNAVDLYDAMQSGKIVLINTAKDLLQKDGSAILGRFFIALITQAAVKRAAVPPTDRVPCFVYVDEAHEYFDEHIEDLLNQARKFRVGLTLAHQNLDQLDTKLRAGVMASTSIKLAGGVSAKDGGTLSKEMRCTPDFIQGARKWKTKTEFACFVRNVTRQPVKISVPLGIVERVRRMRDRDYDTLIARNRELYAAPRKAVRDLGVSIAPPEAKKAVTPTAPEPAVIPAPRRAKRQPPTPPGPIEHIEAARAEHPKRPLPSDIEPEMGKGGREHKYLQQLIKRIGESRGFRATIEHPVGEGRGSVDISLVRGDVTVACEISVTSTSEQELGNVEKCLAAGFSHVLLVAADGKRLKKHEKHIAAALEGEDLARVAFLPPEACADFLDAVAPEDVPAQTVRGYKVRLQYQALSDEEQARRREAIAQVIRKSVRRVGA